MEHNLRLILLALVALIFSVAAKAGPDTCDPREDYSVCELKKQRDNAMDEWAIHAATVRKDGEKILEKTVELNKAREEQKNLVEWWAAYVEGINAQAAWWQIYAMGVEHEKWLRAQRHK